jgi:DNA-binding transcriptional ArsR family regulator
LVEHYGLRMTDIAALSDDRLDRIFQALANTTRRALLQRLKQGPAMVTELASPFGMSLNAISKHLIVLERAGLIDRHIEGRAHSCALRADPLADAETWLNTYQVFWDNKLDKLARFVESGKDKEFGQ